MVLLTLKNLQQQTFTIDIELSSTVKALKEKIEQEKGSSYPADGQKLIYAGKILQDESILETYNIDARKFLVIMVTKPKAPPPSAEPTDPTVQVETSQPEETSTEAAAPTISTSSTSETTTTTTTTTSTTTSTTSSSSSAQSETAERAESTIVMGDEFTKMVDNIVEMGYSRPQVERALRASFNNPYTAVQYLIDGIPANLDQPQGEEAPQSGTGEESGGQEVESAPSGVSGTEDPLEFLRRQPQFNQMRQMIRSNPQLLDAFIQQIGQTNPELLQIIQSNQEAFVQMLNEPDGGASGGDRSSSGAGSGGSTGGASREGGQSTILVSPQDRAAIERLRALGNFPEDVVIQAYFACEKNENLAAEFLFSQTWD